jgi:D-alanine-D-alanine ligase
VCDHIDTTRYDAIALFHSESKIYLLPWHFLHRGKTTDFEHRLVGEAQQISWDDLRQHIDFLYIAEHGCYAEDGTLQGFLELLRIPYFGSGILASALRADKNIHKIILKNAGIEVPRYITIEPYEIDHYEKHENNILHKLDTIVGTDSYIVKPYNEGSSLGISVANNHNLEAALKKACSIEHGKKKRVIVEEKIIGMEFTCIVLTNNVTGEFFALPPTESLTDPAVGFFDYEQKYMPGRGIKRTPARCSEKIMERIQETCIKVMHVLGFTIMSRIDGFVTPEGKIVIIDPNTFSGMAPSSYIFNQAAEIDMSPSQVISHLLTTALQQYNLIPKE